LNPTVAVNFCTPTIVDVFILIYNQTKLLHTIAAVVIDFGFLVWTGKKRGTLQYEYFAAIESRNSTSNESN
jgi:hypothetical protein